MTSELKSLDPSAVLAAMRSRIDQAPMSRFDRDAGRLLSDALQAVLDLHVPETKNSDRWGPDGVFMVNTFCTHCRDAGTGYRVLFPCPTVRIITTALAKGGTS